MTPGTALTLGPVDTEADDPPALAAFWAELLGGTIAGEQDGHVFVAPVRTVAPPSWSSRAPRPVRRTRRSTSTSPSPGTSRAVEVERALGLGAVHRWDVLDEVPWVRWSTLADPEGDLFCIAEHPPSSGGPG